MAKVSLINTNLKSDTVSQKQVALVLMDMMLKRLHKNNYMVRNFDVNNIYFENGVYEFDENKIMPITSVVADNKEQAILHNLTWMSMVALWLYSDNPTTTLISPEFVRNNFDSFSFWYPQEDREYYRSVLVDGTISYYSDYVINKNKNQDGKGHSSNLAYMKATEAGKMFANTDEAAFGHTFFLMTVVASLMVILIGVIFYFS